MPIESKRIGRYIIQQIIGSGGMAAVYEALDPTLSRKVAIKVLHNQALHDSTSKKRFEREIKALASNEFSSIVPIYDSGIDGDTPYIVMRLMTGGSLAQQIKLGPCELQNVIRIMRPIAETLDEVHKRGIIHRDIKPSNILLDQNGRLFLADFGIAKNLNTILTLTDGATIGTPGYMSPEQFVGESHVTPQTDQYAFGITIFEMLAGQHPYKDESPYQLMFRHVQAQLPYICDVRPQLPGAVQPVLEKMTSKKPQDRFQTIQAAIEALNSILELKPQATKRRTSQSKKNIPVVVKPRVQNTTVAEKEKTNTFPGSNQDKDKVGEIQEDRLLPVQSDQTLTFPLSPSDEIVPNPARNIGLSEEDTTQEYQLQQITPTSDLSTSQNPTTVDYRVPNNASEIAKLEVESSQPDFIQVGQPNVNQGKKEHDHTIDIFVKIGTNISRRYAIFVLLFVAISILVVSSVYQARYSTFLPLQKQEPSITSTTKLNTPINVALEKVIKPTNTPTVQFVASKTASPTATITITPLPTSDKGLLTLEKTVLNVNGQDPINPQIVSDINGTDHVVWISKKKDNYSGQVILSRHLPEAGLWSGLKKIDPLYKSEIGQDIDPETFKLLLTSNLTPYIFFKSSPTFGNTNLNNFYESFATDGYNFSSLTLVESSEKYMTNTSYYPFFSDRRLFFRDQNDKFLGGERVDKSFLINGELGLRGDSRLIADDQKNFHVFSNGNSGNVSHRYSFYNSEIDLRTWKIEFLEKVDSSDYEENYFVGKDIEGGIEFIYKDGDTLKFMSWDAKKGWTDPVIVYRNDQTFTWIAAQNVNYEIKIVLLSNLTSNEYDEDQVIRIIEQKGQRWEVEPIEYRAPRYDYNSFHMALNKSGDIGLIFTRSSSPYNELDYVKIPSFEEKKYKLPNK